MKKEVLQELALFFDPFVKPQEAKFERSGTIGEQIFHLHECTQQDFTFDVVLFGLSDYRLNTPGNYKEPADVIRKALYQLAMPALKILDLGNIKRGKTADDSIEAVRYISALLKNKGQVSLLLGATRFLLHAITESHIGGGLSVVSNHLGCDDDVSFPCDDNALSFAFAQENYSPKISHHIGSQRYFVTKNDEKFARANKIHRIGLGQARKKIEHLEPLMRSSAVTLFDISSIKGVFTLGQEFPSPNGFNPEEMCQMAYYAGINDALSCFGLMAYADLKDADGLTAQLVAQIYWHLFDGIAHRVGDYPVANLNSYKKMMVTIDENQKPFVFYKSNLTDRWWIDASDDEQTPDLLPCTYDDYLRASEGEIPDIWLRFSGL